MSTARHAVLDNLKNLRGWRTNRKIIAIAVDDYANVRVASRGAREKLIQAGVDMSSQMDRYDTVETRQDLEALFDVLESVSDGQNRAAIFTAYALSANPNCQKIIETGTYHYEPVSNTFARLAEEQPTAYRGAWSAWRDGMDRGLIRPQFHGREHLNVEMLRMKFENRDPALLANLEHQSMAGLTDEPEMPGVGFTHAFGVHQVESIARHREILVEGLGLFERVWGFRSDTFTPPAQKLHPQLYSDAVENGIRSIDKPLRCTRPLGDGSYQRELNCSGLQRGQDHITVVRNVVFEPGKDMGFAPVERALQQIKAAFRWGKPAVISSHRVNFCGHIDPANRQNGLDALQSLLKQVTEKWPEVEFLSVDQLVAEMILAG